MEPIIKEVTINAPVNVVWDAITDKEQVKHWSFDIPDFKAEVGHEFTFWGGDETKQFLHICRVLEVIPEQKLSYTWRYENSKGDSVVTYELFKESDNSTRVKLTHAGLEVFANDGPDFARTNFVAGWEDIIGNLLKNYIEKK